MVDVLRDLAYGLFPTLATIFITLTYIPQIIKIWKTKSVDDISIWFWILLNAYLVLMWVNSLFAYIDSNNLGYLVAESFNFGLAIIVIVQVIYYKRKNKKDKAE